MWRGPFAGAGTPDRALIERAHKHRKRACVYESLGVGERKQGPQGHTMQPQIPEGGFLFLFFPPPLALLQEQEMVKVLRLPRAAT